MSSVKLDNRIYLLQHTKGLTPHLRQQLYLADIAFLEDHDSDAEAIVSGIEHECERQKIKIFSLHNHPFYGRLVA